MTERWKTNAKYVYAFGVAVVVDIINVAIINSVTGGWNPFQSPVDIGTESGDVLLLCFLRLIFVIPGVLIAITLGDYERIIQSKIAIKKSSTDLERNWNKESSKQKKKIAIKGKEKLHNEAEEDISLVDEESDNGPDHHSADDDVSEEEKEAIKSRCALRKYFVLGLLFFFLTLCEVELGIKSVLLQSDTPKTVGGLLISQIFILNVQLYLVREIIDAFTRDDGYYLPGVHHHPLHFQDRLGHWCDLCRQRLRKGYFCPDCSFDLCELCFKKKNKEKQEHALRGDKGAREDKEVSTWYYLQITYGFLRPHIRIISLALIFLLTNSTAQILLPNYQGRILDHVITLDKSAFTRDIIVYVSLSVFVGLIGGAKNLCFEVVGRRIEVLVRNQLYSSIIVQDIAFFDGTTTGELTSRLGTDTNAMVSPIRSALAILLTSLFSLVGGLIMCLNTSWRLSIWHSPQSALLCSYSESTPPGPVPSIARFGLVTERLLPLPRKPLVTFELCVPSPERIMKAINTEVPWVRR